MDDTVAWVLVIAAVVLIVALIAVWIGRRNAQSRRLRERFGPEYDRTMERSDGGRRRAEAELDERVSRRDELELRPLSGAARETYSRRWQQVQAEFVDQPGPAVRHAQALLDEVMVERGYPIGEDFDRRADLISVDHPTVVDHYRVAHRLHHDTERSDGEAEATEKRRQAFVNYRALFAELLDDGKADWRTGRDTREAAEARDTRGLP